MSLVATPVAASALSYFSAVDSVLALTPMTKLTSEATTTEELVATSRTCGGPGRPSSILGSGNNAAILVMDDIETDGSIDLDDETKVKSRPACLHNSTQALAASVHSASSGTKASSSLAAFQPLHASTVLSLARSPSRCPRTRMSGPALHAL